MSTTPYWAVEGEEEGAGLGFSVAGVGDLNADGKDDFVIGASFHDTTLYPDAGRIVGYIPVYGVPPGMD